jgi:hypothetical protein
MLLSVLIPKALATGRLDLRPDAMVYEIPAVDYLSELFLIEMDSRYVEERRG